MDLILQKKILYVAIFLFGLLMIASFIRADHVSLEVITRSGYVTEYWQYTPKAHKKDAVFIFIHGKHRNPESEPYKSFIKSITNLGYVVFAPIMPWSNTRGYEGTRIDGIEVIESIVSIIDSKPIVIIGHSMGGVATLQFGAATASKNVSGLVSVAAGHDPNHSHSIREATAKNTLSACKLVDEGRGKQRDFYIEEYHYGTINYEASAEYYCSYHSTAVYPDTYEIVRNIKKPVLIVAGSSDELTAIYSKAAVFNSLPVNPKNRYAELLGGHMQVLSTAVDLIADWTESL